MSDLTNLQICKRIAEIENKGDCFNWFNTFAIRTEMYAEREEYNPLTDDALCFQLMVKYDCDLISPYRPNKDTHWECQIFTSDCADAVSIYDDSPSKAICLAIIEAHKDK